MRSAWKGTYQHPLLLIANSEKDSYPEKIYSRASLVTLNLVGATISVYNGKEWSEVNVTQDHTDHRFGEFARTRAFFKPKAKKKKVTKAKKSKVQKKIKKNKKK